MRGLRKVPRGLGALLTEPAPVRNRCVRSQSRMSHTAQGFTRFLAVFALSSLAIPVSAAQRAVVPAGRAPATIEPAGQTAVALSDEQNADQTRERLNQLLENYP